MFINPILGQRDTLKVGGDTALKVGLQGAQKAIPQKGDTIMAKDSASGVKLVAARDSSEKKSDSLLVEKEDEGITTEVTAEADDSVRTEAIKKKVYLYGNAMVHYQDFTLHAEYIEIDNATNLITAVGVADSNGVVRGSPEFKDGQTEMKCEKIIYNIKTKKGKITGILTKQSSMFIHGEHVKKDTNNIMYIKNMKCIPCEFEDGKFYFRAKKAKIIPNDKIVTGPLFVEVAQIPLPIGVPFGFFPNVKNKSKGGIIMPTYGQSQNQGFFLRNFGFFIPTGSKVQAIFYGDIYADGSFALRPDLAYSSIYKYSGTLNLSFSQFNTGIKEDRVQLYNPDKTPIADPNLFHQQRDFRITWTHAQDKKNNPSIQFRASVNAGTSGFGRINNQTPSTYLNNTLVSNIMFVKSFKNSSLTINARHNQNTQTHDIEIDAPMLTYAVNRMFPFKNGLHTTQTWLDKLYIDYTFQTQATIKTKDTLLFQKGNIANNTQYGATQHIPIGTNINVMKYFTLSPVINLNTYTYFNSVQKTWDPVADSMRTFTRMSPAFAGDVNFQANLATKIYGDYLFKSGVLKQIRHLIVPTVGFVYHPDLTGSRLDYFRSVQSNVAGTLINYSRFQNGIYGGPSGAESGQVTFNINNTLDAKVRQKSDSGYKFNKINLLQMLSVGGAYDVAAKTNKWSTINVSARTALLKNKVNLLATSNFDPFAVNSSGQRSDTLQFAVNRKLLRYTGVNFSVNSTINNTQFKGLQKSALPWNITINYNFNAQKSFVIGVPNNTVQTLSMNFSLKPTGMWKVDIMTNYDLKANTFAYTNIRIYRDLRCWEANLNWVPFGYAKQYSLTLNLKTAALRTLKIPKQKQWFDNI